MSKIERLPDVLADSQEWNVPETEGIIGDNTLKLHTKTFGVLTGLYQKRNPIRGTVWVFHQQFGDIPCFGNDVLADNPIDTLIIGIFFCITEPSGIFQMLIVHVFGQKNACCGKLRILIVLQHHPNALISHQLHRTLCIIRSKHGSSGLIVDIYAIIGC